jgi:hypothetical protein
MKLSQTAIGSCLGSIVFREHPTDDVFVDIDAEGVHNPCAMRGQPIWIAAFELDDRVDELLRWPFGPGRDDLPDKKSRRYLRFLNASWNLNKVLGFRMTAS